MLLQAASLQANVDAVRAAQNRVKALINSRITGRSEPIQSCSEVVKFAGQLTELATNFPSNPHSDILAISRKITGASPDTCSSKEKESLHALDQIFDDTVANIVEALDTIQEQLWLVTGSSTISSSSSSSSTSSIGSRISSSSSSSSVPPIGLCGNCVFPFISKGRESDRCTTIDGDPRAWCVTSESPGLDDWEYCTDPTCPGLKGNSEEMSVHPMNALGNCCKLFPFLSSNITINSF